MPRTPDHKEKYPEYPDPDHFLRSSQKYFFRAPELRNMRLGQGSRYCSPAPRAGAGSEEQTSRDTSEDTCNQDRFRPGDEEEAEESHRHYDRHAAGLDPGTPFQTPGYGFVRLTRRKTTNLAVPRSGAFVPVADEMLRGRIRTSNWCGVCSHGMRKCVPSPAIVFFTPAKRSNITARWPPSTL